MIVIFVLVFNGIPFFIILIYCYSEFKWNEESIDNDVDSYFLRNGRSVKFYYNGWLISF